jgi:hypothetical protein
VPLLHVFGMHSVNYKSRIERVVGRLVGSETWLFHACGAPNAGLGERFFDAVAPPVFEGPQDPEKRRLPTEVAGNQFKGCEFGGGNIKRREGDGG